MGIEHPTPTWPLIVSRLSWSVTPCAQLRPSSTRWLAALCIVCLLIFANAAPIPAPDFSQCQAATVGQPFNIHKMPCCPPVASSPIKEFSFPGQDLPLRTRRAAHRLPEDYIHKLNHAYQLMKELPPDDPRSMEQQRRLHCAYCNGAFLQPWKDGAPPYAQSTLQIHFTWLIWPWHRWFLYFHERILASLVGDDDLALPFWNWDNQLEQDAAQIPVAYTSSNYSALFRDRSNASLPPAIADLGIINRIEASPQLTLEKTATPARIREANLNALHKQMVTGASTRALFFGDPYRAGDASVDFFSPTQGLLEAGVHSAIHLWTGGDLAALQTAAADPAFYALHANLDRFWTVWKGLQGGRNDIDDPDWLNTEFLFYDQNAELVRVTAGQALNNENQLGYKYEEVKESDELWINYNASKCSGLNSLNETTRWINSIPMNNGSWFYVSPSATFTTRLQRPIDQKSNSTTAEVLLFKNMQVNWTTFMRFHVFINHPYANSSHAALECVELVGILNSISHARHDINHINYKIDIGETLRELGADSLSEVVISIVVGENSDMSVEKLEIVIEPS